MKFEKNNPLSYFFLGDRMAMGYSIGASVLEFPGVNLSKNPYDAGTCTFIAKEFYGIFATS